MQGTGKITPASEPAGRSERLGTAFTEGRIAGNLDRAAGLNPYDLGSEEYAEWERGRSSAEAQRLSITIARRVRTCIYKRGQACECGGRGLCLDVA